MKSLAGFGLEGKPLAVAAAGGLLHYVKKVRKDSVVLVHKVAYVPPGDRLVLDAATIRNLELVRNLRDGRTSDSLLEIMDLTVTPMGARTAPAAGSSSLSPTSRRINARLDAVAEAVRLTIERREIRDALKGIHDLERLTGKISLAAAHARDLVALKRSLEPLPKVRAVLAGLRRGPVPRHPGRLGRRAGTSPRSSTGPSWTSRRSLLTEGGIVKDGFNAELDELRDVSRSGKTFIARLERTRAGADRHLVPQGPLQQGLRLLHRSHEVQPAPRSRPTTSASRPSSARSGS